MSTKLFVPLEQAKRSLNLSLNDTTEDSLVLMHLISSQAWAESYIRREIDGEKLLTEYYSGNRTRDLIAKSYPIRSVSELNIDADQDFTSATAVSSADYLLLNDRGQITLKPNWTNGNLNVWASYDGLGGFPKGSDNIRLKYYGGWIAEKTVVASAVKTATHTIADSLSTYGQPCNLFIKTTGAFTATSAGVVITGTDENDVSFSETVVPYVTDTTASIPTITFATSFFKTVTVVNSNSLTGAGSISVTAVSMPADLRQAILILTAYQYRMEKRARLGVKSRTTQASSETLEKDELPASAKSILDRYKNINF